MEAELNPQDSHLDDLFLGVARVELRSIVTQERLIGPGPVLLEFTAGELDRLRQSLRIVPPAEAIHCMTWGDHVLHFYAGQQLRCGLEMLDFSALRWSGRWNSDAELADDGLALAHLLAGRGLAEPLAHCHLRQQARQQELLEMESWRRSLPPCLADLWKPGPSAALVAPCLKALHQACADPQSVVRILLDWLGTAERHEANRMELPLAILNTFPTETLVATLAEARPTTLRGAWFFLGGTSQLQYIPRHLREAMRAAAAPP